MVEVPLLGAEKFRKLELIKTGLITVTKAAASDLGSAVVAHNLGYRPAILSFIVDSDGEDYKQLPVLTYQDSGADEGKFNLYSFAWVDITSIIVAYYTPNLPAGNSLYTNSATVRIRYYLLRERSR